MVDASTIIDNEQCRLAGLSIILFAGKLFANCNLSAKCINGHVCGCTSIHVTAFNYVSMGMVFT